MLDGGGGVTSLVNRGLGLPHQALSERKGGLNQLTVRRRYRSTREKEQLFESCSLFC